MNVYSIYDDVVVAETEKDAIDWYEQNVEEINEDADIQELDAEKQAMWADLKEYSQNYIELKGIQLEIKEKDLKLGVLTVIEGQLVEWRKMSEVLVTYSNSESPFLLMSSE